MNSCYKHIVIILFLLSVFQGTAQHNIFTAFKSAEKRADVYYREAAYKLALNLYTKAYRKEQKEELLLKIAYCYHKTGDLQVAEKWYRKAENQEVNWSVDYIYDFAEVLSKNGNHKKAAKWYSKFNDIHPGSHTVNRGQNHKKTFYADSLTYQVRKTEFNSTKDDFSPTFYDGGIVFVSNRDEADVIKHVTGDGESGLYDLYFYTTAAESGDGCAKKFHADLNSRWHAGPLTFYDNEQQVIFSTNLDKKNKSGVRQVGLFMAEKGKNGWGNIQALPFNTDSFSVSHPSFSERTGSLYFISDMPGGYGGTDIYKSVLIGDSVWSAPQNLGETINTPKNEVFPYIHNDSLLYFSSDGHDGIGGWDVFYMRIADPDGKVFNVGYPINSSADDFGIIVAENGKQGYLSSNRENHDNIYAINIKTILFEGKVKEVLNNKGMSDAKISIIEEGEMVSEKLSVKGGAFNTIMKPGKTYTITVEKEGYRKKEVTITTQNKSGKIMQELAMERINKWYLVGSLQGQKENPLSGAEIALYDKWNNLHDTTASDEEGAFFFEFDPKSENLIMAKNDSLIGWKVIAPQEDKKGSVAINVDMKLKSYKMEELVCVVKDSASGEVLDSIPVVIKNVLTGEKEVMLTDSLGQITYERNTQLPYIFRVDYQEKTSRIVVRSMYDRRVELFINRSATKEEE